MIVFGCCSYCCCCCRLLSNYNSISFRFQHSHLHHHVIFFASIFFSPHGYKSHNHHHHHQKKMVFTSKWTKQTWSFCVCMVNFLATGKKRIYIGMPFWNSIAHWVCSFFLFCKKNFQFSLNHTHTHIKGKAAIVNYKKNAIITRTHAQNNGQKHHHHHIFFIGQQ